MVCNHFDDVVPKKVIESSIEIHFLKIANDHRRYDVKRTKISLIPKHSQLWISQLQFHKSVYLTSEIVQLKHLNFFFVPKRQYIEITIRHLKFSINFHNIVG